MKIEKLLRSKFYRSAVVDDAFNTLEITQPEGEMAQVRGIQITVHAYPRGSERNPHTTTMLPSEEAFELARNVIRVHRGTQVAEATRSGISADHVGIHAMSASEALMIEAVMGWEESKLRVAFWQSLREVETAQWMLVHFVRNLDNPAMFKLVAAREIERVLGGRK
jgi:hypothetical protein